MPYRKEDAMSPHPEIGGSQRDALYEQVHNHLAGLGDVVVAVGRNDWLTAADAARFDDCCRCERGVCAQAR